MPKARKAEVDLQQLVGAINSSRMALEPFRATRMKAIKRFAGPYWSTETTDEERPVNFLSLWGQTVSRNLLNHDPRVLLTTHDKEIRPIVTGIQDWANPELIRMNFAETMERAILDALFWTGIVWVGLTTPGDAEMSGWTKEYGQPAARIVDPNDFVIDMHAPSFEEAAFIGHRSRVPLRSIQDSKLYDAVKRKRLQRAPDLQTNEPGDDSITTLQRQNLSDDDVEAYEYVFLWNIFLPREQMVVTLYTDDSGAPSLADFGPGKDAAFSQQNWVGPYCGPYHKLSYITVPGVAMGKGPALDILHMDAALNRQFAKLIHQADRQKTQTLAKQGHEADAERVRSEGDGKMIAVADPEAVKELAMGGPNPLNNQFAMQMWDLLNKIGGNIELMAGLGAQSKTATQDKLLNANASRSVEDMQQITTKFLSKVQRSLCWFWHWHPTKKTKGYRVIKGANPIPKWTTPAQRQKINFDDYDVNVDPYSFRYQTPNERLQFVQGAVLQILQPLAALAQQQGVFVDVKELVTLMSEYGNSPDLLRIIKIAEPPAPAEGEGEPEGPGKPAVTSRNYNRVNSSEATEQGQSKAIQQALLGRNPGGNAMSGMQGAA